jgi:hypothetical protein
LGDERVQGLTGRRVAACLAVSTLALAASGAFASSPLIDPFMQQGEPLAGPKFEDRQERQENGQNSGGQSVALSSDGNTALIGGERANWVYTRSGSTWTQQATLSDATKYAEFGRSVALSGDGNTALIGGPGDNKGVGATWVFTRSGSTWTQQGEKLTGGGRSGQAESGPACRWPPTVRPR